MNGPAAVAFKLLNPCLQFSAAKWCFDEQIRSHYAESLALDGMKASAAHGRVGERLPKNFARLGPYHGFLPDSAVSGPHLHMKSYV